MGNDGVPGKEYLFDAGNNIELGSACLKVLACTHFQIEPGGVKGTNCVTFWTDKLDDPNAEVNPCPANC